jgi:protein-L-isoaspartate(D-aspartate) O-methyltransferase
MVQEQIAARGVREPRVLEAMRTVPRHLFLEPSSLPLAYADQPLPIGHGQTISQPYLVALMAESLALRPGDRVLEVGSGSGYLAAVLSMLALEVCALELEPELFERSRVILGQLGCSNVQLRCQDGALGWPEQAPFDAVVFSCATLGVPGEPWKQLKVGGRFLLPMGPAVGPQELILIEKQATGSKVRHLLPVAFVPLRRP